MSEMLSDILTAEEAAEILKIPVKRLIAIARRGDVPARKIGKEWRFKQSEIVKWFENWQPSKFDPNKRAGEIIEALNGKKEKRLQVA